MKKQPIFTSLQTQYQKLTQLLRTKGNQLSQFKYQQLLNRISRCSLQLKRLGMGMSVCVALGVGTPVMGQIQPYNLVERTGAANPLDGVAYSSFEAPFFVDIDTDGDLDFFTSHYSGTVYARILRYYENTGTSGAPVFIERLGSANPLNGILDAYNPAFVDIDGDGDIDMFAGNNSMLSNTEECYYYQNTGTATNPTFSLQLATNNPLDSVSKHLVDVNTSFNLSPQLSFADIDNDGDYDCFVAISHYGGTWQTSEDMWYYENAGTVNNANFIRQDSASNPFAYVLSIESLSTWITESTFFFDAENDGDLDAFLNLNTTPGNYSTFFYENIGTANMPNFTTSLLTPVDSIGGGLQAVFSMVDIDNDSDLDVIKKELGQMSIRFFENIDTSMLFNVNIRNDFSLNIFPIPAKNILNFEKSITGNISLFNAMGQKIWTKEVYEENKIELSEIDNGIYYIYIEMANGLVCKKILVQK